MKLILILLAITAVVLGGVWLHAGPPHGNDLHQEPVTVSMRQNDLPLCEQAFWVGLYELSSDLFAGRIGQVGVAEYRDAVFAYIRNREDMSAESAEAFIDHIKDVPAQLVEIIEEDPAVVDSCDNFSIALVGPP